MSFPSEEEILRACRQAQRLGYEIAPGGTIAAWQCCPLGAVLIARGLQEDWAEGQSDWVDLAVRLGCDPEEVEAFTLAYEGAPGATYPLAAVLLPAASQGR